MEPDPLKAVLNAHAELDMLLLAKRLAADDYGSLANCCELLAEELDVVLPDGFSEAIMARNEVAHPIHPTTPTAAQAAAKVFRCSFDLLWEETDPPRPDRKECDRIKKELRRGIDKRTFAGTRTRWEKFRDTHRKNEIVVGIVIKIFDDGVLIRLAPGVRGRVDISELSYRRPKHPKDHVREGQKIPVRIIDYVESSSRIILSIKQAQADPWDSIRDYFKEGELVEGVVGKSVHGGTLIDLDGGVNGFVPLNETCLQGPPESTTDFLRRGDVVPLVVQEIRVKRKDIVVSARLGQWRAFCKKYPIGAVASARVVGLDSYYGLNLALERVGVSIDRRELSWWEWFPDATRMFGMGDLVTFRIVSVPADPKEDHVQGSTRRLTDDPWPHVQALYPPGSRVQVKIAEAPSPTGVRVSLDKAYGWIDYLDLVHVNLIVGVAPRYAVGDIIWAVITKYQVEHCTIHLSERQAHGMSRWSPEEGFSDVADAEEDGNSTGGHKDAVRLAPSEVRPTPSEQSSSSRATFEDAWGMLVFMVFLGLVAASSFALWMYGDPVGDWLRDHAWAACTIGWDWAGKLNHADLWDGNSIGEAFVGVFLMLIVFVVGTVVGVIGGALMWLSSVIINHGLGPLIPPAIAGFVVFVFAASDSANKQRHRSGD